RKRLHRALQGPWPEARALRGDGAHSRAGCLRLPRHARWHRRARLLEEREASRNRAVPQALGRLQRAPFPKGMNRRRSKGWARLFSLETRGLTLVFWL